jgi:hypothetical protein
MKLSAKLLKNVANVNCFEITSQWDIAEGSAQRLYFQIVDKNKDDLRYLSQATVIDEVSVTFLSLDEASEIIKVATQAWTDDKSVWYIDLAATEVPNSGSVLFSITEDTVESKFKVGQAIVVDLLEDGSC